MDLFNHGIQVLTIGNKKKTLQARLYVHFKALWDKFIV